MKALSLVLCAVALTACNLDVADSSDVSASGIYQSYRVTYDESQGQLTSSAEFDSGNAGGSSVDLQAPAGVKFDGAKLQKEAFLGLTYDSNETVGFKSAHSWVYTDSASKTYANTATIVPVEIGNVPATISTTNDTTFTFGGAPLGDNESISVMLTINTSTGLTSGELSVHVAPGSNTGVITAADLRNWGTGSSIAGSGTLQISRVKSIPLQQATPAGGSISAEYRSKSTHVTIR